MIYKVKVEYSDDGEEAILTLPDEIVNELGLKPGDIANFNLLPNGAIEVTFDKMTDVEIELEDKDLFKLMTWAHEQDITLNQLVNNILRKKLDAES